MTARPPPIRFPSLADVRAARLVAAAHGAADSVEILPVQHATPTPRLLEAAGQLWWADLALNKAGRLIHLGDGALVDEISGTPCDAAWIVLHCARQARGWSSTVRRARELAVVEAVAALVRRRSVGAVGIDLLTSTIKGPTPPDALIRRVGRRELEGYGWKRRGRAWLFGRPA